MVARASMNLVNAAIRPKTVAAGQSVTAGRLVERVTDDFTVQHAGAGESAIGVVIGKPGQVFAAGEEVSVILLAAASYAKVLVGTGGATAGLQARVVADGVTNAGTASGGAAVYTVGQFVDTGVVGDWVGMIPGTLGLIPTDAP